MALHPSKRHFIYIGKDIDETGALISNELHAFFISNASFKFSLSVA